MSKTSKNHPDSERWSQFVAGRGGHWVVTKEGHWERDSEVPTALIPGSFNPAHQAHFELAEYASRDLGLSVGFELSVWNVDKVAAGLAEIVHRARQFHQRFPLVITRSATFVQKASLRPNLVFLVGSDTAARILDPAYYGGDPEEVSAGLHTLKESGVRFHVAGRINREGRFVKVSDLEIAADFRDLFLEIPALKFRYDISSSEIRARSAQQGNSY